MKTKNSQLEPIEPREAAELWLDGRRDDVSDRTFELDSTHVTEFVEWLSDEGIDCLNEVSGRDVHRFRLHIKNGISATTLSIRLGKVRRFLRFCASINAVDPNIPETMEVPKRSGEARTESVESERAEAILEYLGTYQYASRLHALTLTAWHTGCRTGTIRGLDVSDFQREQERLRVRHRPDTDTPLKNGESAERYIALSPHVVDVLADYVDEHREDVEDEYGRDPLFSTECGRAPKATIRRWFYNATKPCMVGSCPFGTEPSECRAADSMSHAYKCEGTVSGHPWRRGAITHYLREDVPPRVVSDRMDVSQDVLSEHYDVRTDEEKTEQRRRALFGD